MRIFAVVGALFALTAGGAAASEEVKVGPGPYTLDLGAWVCRTPELYHETIDLQRQGQSPFKLSQRLLDEGKCIYVDDDTLEDLMQPFVAVLVKRDDGMAKVSFFIEFYKKFSEMHNSIKLVKFIGWTATDNVKKHIKAD